MSDERVLVQQTHPIMACPVELYVAVEPGDEARAEAAMAECAAWLREVDARLTRFRPDSELSALNASGEQWFTASEMLFEVVELSVAAAEATGGLFDPTLLPLLEALGYDRDFKSVGTAPGEGAGDDAASAVPCAGSSSAAARTGTWRCIELDAARRRIRLPRGTRLDLGGIAKGWAADVALERFFERLPGAIVSVGGDLRARGGLSETEPWALGIGDPRGLAEESSPRSAAVLTLARGGLATSGAVSRWWWHGGARQHHLLDPRTGLPARLWLGGDGNDDGETEDELIASATALAPSATEAEVAAKVALLRGYPQALADVEAGWHGREACADGTASVGASGGRPSAEGPIALLLVMGSGRVVCSENMPAYLESVGGGGEIWLD